jgi:hypothetical protein
MTFWETVAANALGVFLGFGAIDLALFTASALLPLKAVL